MFKYVIVVLGWWNCLEGIRRCALIGSCVMGVSFEVSKPTPFGLLCLVLVDQDMSSRLLLWCHACLSAARLPAMTVMDTNPLIYDP